MPGNSRPQGHYCKWCDVALFARDAAAHLSTPRHLENVKKVKRIRQYRERQMTLPFTDPLPVPAKRS